MSGKRAVETRLPAVGDWYSIGVALGVGIALGTLFAGLLPGTRLGRGAALVLAGAAGALAGVAIDDTEELVAGGLAGLVGAAAAFVVVSGALRRGGTRAGLALIVAGVALVLAALAFVPGVGYLLVLVLTGLAVRLRRTRADRYAGLRSLAKD